MTRMRIVSMQVGLPGELRLQCLLDDAGPLAQYTSGGVGNNSGLSGPTLIGAVVASDFYAWSGAELRAADQASPGFYVAACGGPGWIGGEVLYSTNGGTDYISAGPISVASVIGSATNTLADWTTPATQDTTNTLDVTTIDGGSLTSTSDSAAHVGDNAAVIGGEIFSFATASLVGTSQYALSRLWRGERASPSTGHVAAETFVLAGSGIVRVNLPESLVGSTVKVKVVSQYQDASAVTAQNVVIAERTPTSLETTVAGLGSTAGTYQPVIVVYGPYSVAPGSYPTIPANADYVMLDTSGSLSVSVYLQTITATTRPVWVKNVIGPNSGQVFTSGGETIDGGGTNVVISTGDKHLFVPRYNSGGASHWETFA